MKKKIVIIFIILILALSLVSCHKVDYDQLKVDFDNLLQAGSYESANALYETAEDELISSYQQSLDDYSAVLIENAQVGQSFEQAKAMLDDFLVFEHTRLSIQEALDKIIAEEQVVIQSNADYIEGTELFLDREFSLAYEKLSAVKELDESYKSAQDMIAELEKRAVMWDDAAANSTIGRNPAPNSLAYRDGYTYFPVDSDDVHSIVKYNYATGEAAILPLIEFVGTFHIRGISVIDDYIYFTAGEELGSGIMLESPYNIYEMKTDGTELTMVKSGDYFDLISYGDIFYALSYSKGLVKMDRNFDNEEVISDKRIIEMQATDAGVYYTEKLENAYDSMHILYLYKDGQSAEIMQEEMLHGYVFDTYSIFYKDMRDNSYESISVADLNFENPIRVALLTDGGHGDINGFVGALGDKIMISTAGWIGDMRHERYAEIQISKRKVKIYQNLFEVPAYNAANILYEEGVVLVKAADGTYSFTDVPAANVYDRAVSIPVYDAEQMSVNMSVISENRPGDDDFYSEDEIVAEYDSFWYYSSPNLNVTIEAIYDEYAETMVYVANIRTKDNSGFDLGYYDQEAPGLYTVREKTDDIATINKAVFATNADFALLSVNSKRIGKIIRDDRIFEMVKDKGIREYDIEDVYDMIVDCRDFLAMYPDGTMAVYTQDDEITYGQLIDAGVKNTIAFGPILVRDNQKTSASTDPNYLLSCANPRTAWGMVEPGHFVSVVAEGRQAGVNRGMSYYTLADYFQKLGCSMAYNVDGGQSSAIVFMGRFLNSHRKDLAFTNHRPVQEIIYFGTSDLVPADLENYYDE